VADAHLDHHFFQITTPRLGARPSLGSLAHLEGDRLTEASLKLLFTSMLTADGKETDYGGCYVGRDSRAGSRLAGAPRDLRFRHGSKRNRREDRKVTWRDVPR